jgi:ribosomal protein S12 methylthiotransferase accessory factor YcaO
MNLKSCKKIAYGRCETPENTVKRLETIIGKLHNYTFLEERVSEYLYWSALFIDEQDFRSMGKGVTAILSKAGALAEGAEWLTTRETGLLPGFVTSHQKHLENPLRLEDLLSHVASATPPILEKVKNQTCAQYWVDGESLMTGQTLKVPLEYIRRISGPSGVAAGNRIEEAIVHATNEVFERRAHITVLRKKMILPTIDPDSIDNPILQAQLDFVRSKGIDVYIKDLSFDGALPCIGAYFLDPGIPAEFQFHHFFKVGASFTREDALIRCFTEYTQGRRTDEFVPARRAEQARVLNVDFRNLKCVGNDGDNFLSAFMFGMVPYTNANFLKAGEVIPFDKGEPFDDCLDDIERAKEVCRALGKDYIVVDLTDPEIGFPVVQVIIPGYSDVLPYHPSSSRVLFRKVSQNDVLKSYDKAKILELVGGTGSALGD